jgi:hypothetical protein
MKWVGEDGLSLLHFGRKMFAPSKKGFSGANFGRMRPLAPTALDKNEPEPGVRDTVLMDSICS